MFSTESRSSFVPLAVLLALFAALACADASETAKRAPVEVGEVPYDVARDGDATEELPDVEATEDDPLVLFLGDSLSAGLHLPAREAFPAVLQRKLAAEGLPFRLINAGVSGDTTAGGLGRIDWLLKQSPDLVVVELGGNDGLRGLPLEEIERNLRAIVERVQAANARVLLCGMLLPPNYGADYVTGFAAVFERVATDLETAYLPFFLEGVGGVPELNLPDQLHPNAAGHRRVAENLMPLMRELLRELDDA